MILTRSSDPTVGSVQDEYGNALQSKVIDTSIWHHYDVVVNDDYTYSVYVDGELAWSGAESKGSGNKLLKIGSDQSGYGGDVSDFDLDYFRISRGEMNEGVTYVGSIFTDANGETLNNLEDANGSIINTMIIENASNTEQEVKIVMNVFKDNEIIDTITQTVTVGSWGISEFKSTATLPSNLTGMKIEVDAFIGENFETSIISRGILFM